MTQEQKSNEPRWLRFMKQLCLIYVIGIIFWVLLRTLFGDSWWWLYFVNVFSVYLFFPSAFLLLFAIFTRQRIVWIYFGIVFIIGGYCFGELFVPKTSSTVATESLTVMTTNVLAGRGNPNAVIESIREADADIVALQELDSSIAATIESEMSDEFPYQILAPDEVPVYGMGIISKYPFEPIEHELTNLSWIGLPQIVEVDFNGEQVVVINFHAIPPGIPSFSAAEELNWRIAARNKQMSALMTLVVKQDLPVILLGDLNATDQNAVYKTVTNSMLDAWRAKGFGLGNTYERLWRSFPFRWIVRIDYVFHSPELETIAVQAGPWDGYSDHRPVVAELILKDK